MTDPLRAGLKHELWYTVPESKTVPQLYPNVPEYEEMPSVFATGFLVGLIELACIRCVNPYLDWPNELTVGTHVDFSHEAATPPGLNVSVRVELVEVDDRRLEFSIEATDIIETISQGTHERYIVNRDRFMENAKNKEPY